MIEYHDREWGVPVHDDRHLFELLILDGAQAGLSWRTILRKREGYRTLFRNFAPEVVAGFGPDEITELLTSPAIVRNRGKIESAVRNARAFLRVAEEFGSFDSYIWRFVGGEPIRNAWSTDGDVPAETEESTALSTDLRRRGFGFVGPTICYAVMQSAGMVNDHTIDCFRYVEVLGQL